MCCSGGWGIIKSTDQTIDLAASWPQQQVSRSTTWTCGLEDLIILKVKVFKCMIQKGSVENLPVNARLKPFRKKRLALRYLRLNVLKRQT